MFEQGDIVVVPFPFSDLSTMKQRPVLILSKSEDNVSSREIITCGITSNLKNKYHSVIIDNSNLLEGKIPTTSRIKVNKLFTLEKESIIKKLARIDKETFSKVRIEFFKLV